MKCPKCGYLGFESADRCRNCGYDFSLAAKLGTLDLPIRDRQTDERPNENLPLVEPSSPKSPTAAARDAALPLFLEAPDPGPVRPPGEDTPLITAPRPPRPPLAVRRSTPEVPRLRSTPTSVPRHPSLEWSPSDADERPLGPKWQETKRALEKTTPTESASIVSRTMAAIVDLAVLAVVDLVVIYFTIKICGLTMDDFRILPKGPLLAFLVAQNGGYLVAFTRGGQTLGKMFAGIRVVSASSRPLDLGHSILRTVVWAALLLPAGLGLVTACFGPERRGLHDRLAGTKVVRASA
jgi:uncharacterized RDD family membrane protein YckC